MKFMVGKQPGSWERLALISMSQQFSYRFCATSMTQCGEVKSLTARCSLSRLVSLERLESSSSACPGVLRCLFTTGFTSRLPRANFWCSMGFSNVGDCFVCKLYLKQMFGVVFFLIKQRTGKYWFPYFKISTMCAMGITLTLHVQVVTSFHRVNWFHCPIFPISKNKLFTVWRIGILLLVLISGGWNWFKNTWFSSMSYPNCELCLRDCFCK